ncbi:MAG: HYR domain-containing protein [Flavobacteriales bacterium]|nr:HYR domain-containing protein [Flavobacteriales bacterium]
MNNRLSTNLRKFLAVFACFFCVTPLISQNNYSENTQNHQSRNGMVSKERNYYSFENAPQSVIHSELNVHTDQKFQSHPEYGVLPYNAQCEDCFEVIDKRTATSRYYIQKGSNGTDFYNQEGMMPINYLDANGDWRAIDPRMFPSPNEPNVYRAINQEFPTEIDLNNNEVAVSNKGNQLVFNKKLKLFHKTETSKTLVAIANWNNSTVGVDGAYITNVFPGIDMEIRAVKGAIKTNFIVKNKLNYTQGWLFIEDEMQLPMGSNFVHDQAKEIDFLGEHVYQGALSIQSAFTGENQFEIGEAIAFDNATEQRVSKVLSYHIDGNYFSTVIPIDWMNDPSMVYPVTIDPLVSSSNTLAQGSIGGSGGNGSGSWSAASACSYGLSVATPTNCVITDVLWSFTYLAQNGAIKNDGALDILYGACRSPNNPLLYWTCQDGFAGACAGTNVSIFSDYTSCIPSPQCASYSMNFTLRFYDAFGGACSNLFIAADSDWVMTVRGQTVEQPAAPTSSAGSTICSGQSTTLTASGSFGVPPYNYAWSPAGSLSNASLQNPVASPTVTTVYTATITDGCGIAAVNTITITVDGAVANAGSNATICSNQSHTISGASIGGTASSQSWGSSGDGGFSNASLLNPVYTPGPGDIGAGSVTLTMTTNNPAGPCNAVSDFMVLTIDPEPTVSAGGAASICIGATYTLSGAFGGSAGSITWGSSGDGGFNNTALPGATYTPGPGDIGAGTVTLTITTNNPAGPCAAANDFMVLTIADIINPTIVCPGNISVSNDGGVCNSAVTVPVPVTADNCTVASLTNDFNATGNASGTYPLGSTTVNWTVLDGAGNSNSCSMTVTVNDTENPTITCPGAVGVNVDGGLCTASGVALGAPVTADNCSVSSTTNNAPVNFPLGATTVTWTVLDGAGNSATCTQTVTVTDNINPTITCPGAVSVSTDAGLCTASGVALGVPVTADNCSVSSTTNDAPVNFPIGATTVTWTVLDGSGNSAICTQTVTVTDNENPTITCPANVTVSSDAGVCTASGVSLGAPVTADNCALGATSNNAPATYPLGATTVTWTVLDAVGNSATCTQTVTVTDNENPNAVCQNISVALDAAGNASIVTGDINNGSADNCSIASMSLDITAFGCADIGANAVTLTLIDGAGNSSTCGATVTITDPNVPTATVGLDATICDYDTHLLAGTTGGSAIAGTWTSSLDGTFSLTTDPNATYTPGPLAIAAGSVVLTWTTDPSPCATANASLTLTINPAPTYTVTISTNPSACGVSDGSILISGLDPITGYTLTYDSAGITINVGGIITTGLGDYLVSGLGADSYNNWTITINGCTTVDATSIGLSDPSAPTFTVAITQQPTSCSGTQGEITISGLNATTVYDISYDDGGTIVVLTGVSTDGSGNYIITGLDAGTYTTFIITLAGCTGSDATVLLLIDPPAPTFTVTLTTNPSSCGGVDGSITISGLSGSATYDITYDDDGTLMTLLGVTTDGSGNYIITGLNAGNYDNWTVTDGINCTGTDVTVITLVDPGAPTFTVAFTTDPSICGASDGSITISGLLGTTTYTITYDDDGTLVTLTGITTDGAGNYVITGLNAGNYDNWTVSLAGCTGSDATVIALTDPPPPTFTITFNLDPTTCGGIDGAILISGLTAGTTYDLGYDDDGTPVSVLGIVSDGSGNYLLTGLNAGNYDNWTITLLGCVGSDVTVITLTDPGAPIFTVVFTSDPTFCGATDGSITISGLLGSQLMILPMTMMGFW